MPEHFNRRIFSGKSFVKDSCFLLIRFPQMIGIIFNKNISKAFMEKIMTVVTAVNGCTYCTWFHAKQALSSGLSENEIKNMLNLQFDADATDFELPALLYAQHYAETNRNPDEEMNANLRKHYDLKTANQIILIIRMIFFGNLQGNTFDAFISRMKGIKAENSNFLFEFIFFLFNAPILVPIMPFVKKYRT